MSWGKKAEDKFKEFVSLCVICLIIFLLLGFATGNFGLSGILAGVVLLVGSLGILGLTKD
jgi:Na+/melibiose symporter-like transporter